MKEKDLGQLALETLMIYKRQPIRLLLVEDIHEDAELAKHELRDCAPNCLVEHVWTGEEAISLVQNIANANLESDRASETVKQFDVAIVDLVLPGKSGIESAERMVGFAPMLIIFICSGHIVPTRAMEEAVHKGFAILPKPMRRVHVEMVLNAVKSAKEKMAIDPVI